MEQNENNHSSNHGYVYILSNPGMPGLLKIGMTRFDPTRRVQELSSATGVPTPFQLVYYREFHDCVAAELEIHSIFATKGLRYNDQREFFSVDTVEAINTLLSLDDEEIANITNFLILSVILNFIKNGMIFSIHRPHYYIERMQISKKNYKTLLTEAYIMV